METKTSKELKITDKTFSIQKLFGKEKQNHSALIFNGQFYLQIENPFEENCDDFSEKRIQHYQKPLEFLPPYEEHYFVQDHIESIIEVLLYIQIPIEQLIPFIFKQFRVYSIENEAKNKFNSLETNFVSLFIIPFIAQTAFKNNPQRKKEFKDQMQQYCKDQNKIWIHGNLFNLRFDPIDKDVAMKALQSNDNKYFKAKENSYIQWKTYKDIIANNDEVIFQEKNEYYGDEFTNSDSIQQFINKKINGEKFDFNCRTTDFDFQIQEEKKIKIEGYSIPRIQVEMRKQGEKLRLATKCSNLEFLPYLMKKFKNQQLPVSKVARLQSVIQNSKSLVIYIDIQEMSFNFDYDIIEKVFKLTDLAKYLKTREVFFKEDRLTLKKGVLLGEVYHPYLLHLFAILILKNLKQKLEDLLEEIGSSLSFQHITYKDDFLFHIKDFSFGELSTDEIQAKVESIMKELEISLNQIGFQMNKEKSRVLYSQTDQPIKLWKLNSEYQLEGCDDFYVLKRSLLNSNKEQEKINSEKKKEEFKKCSEKIERGLKTDIEDFVLNFLKNDHSNEFFVSYY